MKVTSRAFAANEPIPQKYTGDGDNLSPPLSWEGQPDGTKSFALICDDPDAPNGTFVHWVIFNIPSDRHTLPEAVPTNNEVFNALQGKNDLGDIGYDGPAPPKGKPHHYFFRVYALDKLLDLKAGASRKDLDEAMRGHILHEGQLVGLYGRK
jgi:Raf kinase inhibitor-like YbhB/YbcL family protein